MIVVFGGRGVFGSLIIRELEALGLLAVSVSRHSRSTLRADVTDRASCIAALRGASVAVHCAGPFGPGHAALLEVCLQSGCHYADIAEDREHQRLVRSFGERFKAKGLTAAFGCSSLPGISGALLKRMLERGPGSVERVRVTLFIGNRNPKGAAALRSAAEKLRKESWVVELPEPIASKRAFEFDGPELDLFPEMGIRSTSVGIAFESRLAPLFLRLPLAILGTLAKAASAFSLWGSSAGAVQVELGDRRVALIARENGQRMAALPCALAAAYLSAGRTRPGAWAVHEIVPSLFQELASRGFQLVE